MEVFDDPVITTPEDTYLYDFKQNASGIIKLKVTGKKGQTLRLHPAERLRRKRPDEPKNLRNALLF